MRFAVLEEPPFCFTASDGSVVGCDVELARDVLRRLELELEPVAAEFSELIPGLTSGRFAMTTGLFVTPERQASIAFSRPIWALADALLVLAGNPRRVTGLQSWTAGLLAVVEGHVQEERVLRAGVPADTIARYPSQAMATEAVRNGEAYAYLTVEAAHRGYLRQHHLDDVEIVALTDNHPPVGAFGLARDDPNLRSAIDTTLAQVIGTRAHRALMRRYGFTDPDVDRVIELS